MDDEPATRLDARRGRARGAVVAVGQQEGVHCRADELCLVVLGAGREFQRARRVLPVDGYLLNRERSISAGMALGCLSASSS